MFEWLKKAWHATKAWGAGVSAYVTTLFNTEGTFAEANSAAIKAYDREYDRSMGVAEPSVRVVAQQLGRGDFEGALDTTGRGVENVGTRIANAVLGRNQAGGAKPNRGNEEDIRAEQQRADERKQAQAERRAVNAAGRNAVRHKHGIKGHEAVDSDALSKAKEKTAPQQGFWQKLTGGKKAKDQTPTQGRH